MFLMSSSKRDYNVAWVILKFILRSHLININYMTLARINEYLFTVCLVVF